MSWPADTQSRRGRRSDSGTILTHGFNSGVCKCKQRRRSVDLLQLCCVIPCLLITAKIKRSVLRKPLYGLIVRKVRHAAA